MLNIAICDDEPVAVSILNRKIAACFASEKYEVNISTYTDSAKLRDDIMGGVSYQVLFLDIDMPLLNGINLAEHLRSWNYSGLIIFITSRSEMVFESFRVQPFRFIRKTKFTEEIPIVVRDLIKELTPKKEETLVFHRGVEVVRVNPLEIMYVESQRKLQYIHTPTSTLEVNSGMEEICAQLSDFGLIRIHKSYLVNYRFIHRISGTDVILDNRETLPVSRQRVKEVKQQFQELVMKDM